MTTQKSLREQIIDALTKCNKCPDLKARLASMADDELLGEYREEAYNAGYGEGYTEAYG